MEQGLILTSQDKQECSQDRTLMAVSWGPGKWGEGGQGNAD